MSATEKTRREDVDVPLFIIGRRPSTSNNVHVHLPAVDADGEVRPVCSQGRRDDRDWRAVSGPEIPLGATHVCTNCDPTVEREESTNQNKPIFRALEDADSFDEALEAIR